MRILHSSLLLVAATSALKTIDGADYSQEVNWEFSDGNIMVSVATTANKSDFKGWDKAMAIIAGVFFTNEEKAEGKTFEEMGNEMGGEDEGAEDDGMNEEMKGMFFSGWMDTNMAIAPEQSALMQMCAVYPDEMEMECGWTGRAEETVDMTYTVSYTQALADSYLKVGEEVFVSSVHGIMMDAADAEGFEPTAGTFMAVTLSESGASSLLATGAALIASLMLF